MASMTMQQSRRIALMTVAVALAGAAGCVEEHWSESHTTGTRLSAARPECPQVWDTIPMYPVKPQSGPVNRTTVTPPPATEVLGSAALTAPGPITDIPEFHDCQKFVVPESAGVPAHYGALFAIFAAFKLDSIEQFRRDTKLLGRMTGDSASAVAVVT